ncbi:hypothetical protein [Demequina sp. NBRC 110056]|uniref:arsenate reductase/protein-tyrosine-phosphatase family protein n=1 Tax=Demequina sp. NBRC 110056 TaxID=1570345 RepID=UPI0013565A05|nr:hypothetical protein [Demequina sp. NBRC 110056]
MTSILTVCTGNICRSPAAELLLREYLGDIAVISSAGTSAMTGHGIPAEMLMNLDGAGLDGREHRAQPATVALLQEADLVIVMAAEHRTRIVQDSPAALRKTFLLDEIARAGRANAPLDGATPAERLCNVPAAIRDFRPELASVSSTDVPDPYRRSQARYDEAFAVIDAAVKYISAWVRG